MPIVCSTIIPTINRPSLERAVKSVLDQDFSPELHETIVVNDSGFLLPEYDWLKEPNITIINTYRCERCVARNTGAAIASGKYLHFLDDDDYLLPGALNKLITKAESSDCAWIYGALNRVDDDDIFMSTNNPTIRGNIFGLSVVGETIHLSASLIKRESFFQIGGFDPLIRTAEDRDLQTRIALVANFLDCDSIVSNVRVGVGRKSSTDWSRAKQDHRIIREKTLNFTDTFSRILSSLNKDYHLRGRCCRAYLISFILNLRGGYLFIAASRLLLMLRLMGFYFLLPDFWRGLFYLSYWHAVEKEKEEKYFATKA